MLFFYLLIFFYWSFFYLPLLSKAPFGGDSSELVSAMVSWGIAHPPGYPFYMLLGNIFFRLFPLGNVYQKASFLSAIFVFFSSIFLFELIKKLTKKKMIGLLGSLFYLSLFPVWLYGIVPEVFALANFLILGQIWILFELTSKKESKKTNFYFFLFGLFLGLSFSHHHLFILFLPSYFYFWKKKLILKKLLKISYRQFFLGLILGISFYLYPPIVSFLNTRLDIENAKTIEGLIRLITRASYGSFRAYVGSGGDFLNRIFDSLAVFIFLLHDFKILGLFFCFLGFLTLKKISFFVFKFFLINVFFLLFFYFYSNFFLGNSFGLATYERFLTFLYPLLIVFFGFGILGLNNFLKNYLGCFTKKKIFYTLFKITSYFLPFILISVNLFKNYQILIFVRNNQKFADMTKAIFYSLPFNCLFIPQSDHSYFLIENLQIVFNLRNDVIIIPTIFQRDYIQKRLKSKNPKLYFPKKNEDQWSVFLEKNFYQGFSIFSDRPMKYGFWLPIGLVWQYFPKREIVSDAFLEEVISKNIDFWKNYQLFSFSSKEKNILFIEELRRYYIRQFWAFLNFLVVNNKILLAKEFAEKYFFQAADDKQFLIAYINIKVFLKECDKKLALIVREIKKSNLENSFQYLPLLNYYKTCEKDEEEYKNLQQRYQRLKDKEEGLLKNF